MDLLLLLFYLGFCLAFVSLPGLPDRSEIPDWLGGSYTPHGAFLNKSPNRWIILVAWAAVIGGIIIAGEFVFYIPLLNYFGDLLAISLFILGLIGLSFRLSCYSTSFGHAEKADALPNFDTFRVYYSSPAQYAQLCQEPDVSSRMIDTPYTFLKELPKVGLRAALRAIPTLPYQPVVREITQKTDEYLIRLLEETHGHADKALAATTEMDALRAQLTETTQKIALLETSETQARKDLERMQSRTRTTSTARTVAEMTLDELKAQRTTMMEELRKMDQAIRNLQPNPASTTGLPSLKNPDFSAPPPTE